jgi:dihydroorotate dehydrogenase
MYKGVSQLIEFSYKKIAKPIFFKMDPEFVHDRMTWAGKLLGTNFITRQIVRVIFSYSNPILKQNLLGVTFQNPIGLSAGFDKNANLTDILPSVGFGFEEVGSITGEPCEGNPKPRLWRHANLQSLRVYYGLKNKGAEKIAEQLKNKKFKFPIGISIAKTNCEETCSTENGIKDYLKAYKAFENIGDYITINISCPNAFGGQPFTNPEKLNKLLLAINKNRNTKPIFLKLSPDLSITELHKLATIAKEHKIEGLICSNLTKQHGHGKGGLSGKQVDEKSDLHLKHLAKHFKNDFVLIAVGGIFSAEDAYKKIKNGASLVQLITGMIFNGPQLIGQINRELVELIMKDDFDHISEAVGVDVK